jgi:hypothetical protein
MTAPCGDPACPVAETTDWHLAHIRPAILPAGSRWWRGTRYPAEQLTPGVGDTRFAPLAGTVHAYFGFTKTVALLESALHDAAGPNPAIFTSRLTGWTVHPVELTRNLRLADLRNDELVRLKLSRDQLVDTTALHYPCTRQWAAKLQGNPPTGNGYEGAIWHSRQAELYAQIDPDSLIADVLHHVAAEVAVMWSPPGPATPFAPSGPGIALVEHGNPTRFLEELAFLIGASFE